MQGFVCGLILVPVHALSLPAAHLGKEARSLQYGTGLAVLCAMATPAVSSGDLEHTLAVFVD